MPLCTLHLLSLHHTTPNPLQTFLSALQSSSLKPLVVSRVIRWIIRPTQLSTEYLLNRNIAWDLLLVTREDALEDNVESLVQQHWRITAGVPSRLLNSWESTNDALLKPTAGSVPVLSDRKKEDVERMMRESSQDLVMSPALDEWINAFLGSGSKTGWAAKEAKGAVSMFNLLAFKPGMKEEYLKYGKAFAESAGSKFGGNAKIVGNVVSTPSSSSTVGQATARGSGGVMDAGQDGWNEIALAHYPSIAHFRDMLLSNEYQDANQKYRVGSLKDTCILMTSEVGITEMMAGPGSKL